MKKKNSIDFILKLAMAILFLAGAAVFSYPFVVDSLNNMIDQRRIAEYQTELQMDQARQAEKLAEIQEKNRERTENNVPGLGIVEDPFETAIGNMGNPDRGYFEDHMLGAIYIPAINVSLPIFDETNDVLLQRGATLLQGTSYPIGGTGSHSVITGHTGIPEKQLFTDLIDLHKGDLFYIDVLGERLAYEVREFKTVLPTEVEALKIEEGEDLVTLLTCTPYGVNSHRLLVTGTRVSYVEEMDQEINQAQNYHFYRLALIIAGIALFLMLFFYWLWRKIVLFGSTKRKYNLRFHVNPDTNPSFVLTNRKGHVLEGDNLQPNAIEEGIVLFENIPGGKYWVAVEEKNKAKILMKGKVWHLKDKEFRLKGLPKKNLIVEKVKKTRNYYLKEEALARPDYRASRNQLIQKLVLAFVFLVGALIMLYPFYSDALNNIIDQTRLASYQQELSNEQERLEALRKENEALVTSGNNPDSDPFADGGSNLSVNYREHLIGSINIPKIAVEIPVFDTTNDSLLNIGATVLQGTSQPVGGESTHSVISAHRGLPEKQLFTDLPDLENGDVFVLTILGEKLAYEVDQTTVVLPNETETLRIVPGEDLVTLLTCTPYMINSHRLLVRGHRVPYTEEVEKAVEEGDRMRQLRQLLIIAALVLLALLFLYMLFRSWRTYRLRKENMAINFYVFDKEEEPIIGGVYQLMNAKGKKSVQRNGKDVTATSDDKGEVLFEDIPKGMYVIKLNRRPDFWLRTGYKKLKQKDAIFKTKKEKSFIIKTKNGKVL